MRQHTCTPTHTQEGDYVGGGVDLSDLEAVSKLATPTPINSGDVRSQGQATNQTGPFNLVIS